MTIETKQLHALSKIYKEAVYGGGKKEAPKDTRMVVTNADKKANTKAYQNMKAGVKGYKAADHMGEEKKAAKDYDGDGKVESGKEEYFGSKDKAIKKAMGKKIKEGMSNWRHDLKEIPDYDQIPETSKARNKKIEEKKVKNTVKINPDMKEGYGDKKKKKHDCASKVKHEEFGVGNCIKGMHTIDENNMVTHYDVEFEEYIVENCPVEELEILVSEMHMHKEMKEGVVSKEVKALQKAGKTLKDTPVVKADKIDTPNYKGQKFGVKEADDWIQKAVKRPGAFTRKAKAAGQSVQQFAKTVDDNPGKYSTRTKKQANLAQTFASMKKEDVEELFYTLITE